MNKEEFEFTLFDREVKTKELSKQYDDLLSKSCIAFSNVSLARLNLAW